MLLFNPATSTCTNYRKILSKIFYFLTQQPARAQITVKFLSKRCYFLTQQPTQAQITVKFWDKRCYFLTQNQLVHKLQ
jgi:hypothetical protein